MTHNLCHLFFLLGGILCQGQCPVHLESFSKLVPPGKTVFKAHTVAEKKEPEGCYNSVQKQPKTQRIGGDEKQAWPPTIRGDSRNH